MSGEHEVVITSSADVVAVRQLVRSVAIEVGLSLVDQTKIVTAASELARNALVYADGGDVRILVVENGHRRGLKLIVTDDGPGIPDLELALTDGWTTGKGLGLGLSGSRRLVDEFDLLSGPEKGTTVTVTKWAR
ncbi:anti-sigma regulatory factor [Nonomuraea fuscirosea]|uniref:anti-sigma regulatory factor n=1 Tax=Nonomuraea fuscirosea TaxID=1291556 RepID=UPI00341D3295